MAEGSTARFADGAPRYDDDATKGLDSWISRQSRLTASERDSPSGWQGAAAPQWHEDVPDPYEESYQPGNTYQEHERRPARHRRRYEDEHEQYGGALGEERRGQGPYGPIDVSSVHEDAYTAQQDWCAQPEAGYAHEEYYPRAPRADPGGRRTRGKHSRERVARPRPARRRRRWLIPVGGLALGALLCVLAFTWEPGQPPEVGLPVSVATPPDLSEEPIAFPEMPSTPPSSAAPQSSSATPSATPSVTPSATPSATPPVTPSATPAPTPTAATPTQTQSSSPVLLGPSSRRGVADMAQRYCDRYTGGSAESRSDGRWQCRRLLSASIVDMNVACRDTYESGAYAQTSNPGDAYAWRCYR